MATFSTALLLHSFGLQLFMRCPSRLHNTHPPVDVLISPFHYPAHTQTVNSGELREALRILGGSDTLSEREHRALFKGIGKGRDRVHYRVSVTEFHVLSLGMFPSRNYIALVTNSPACLAAILSALSELETAFVLPLSLCLAFLHGVSVQTLALLRESRKHTSRS